MPKLHVIDELLQKGIAEGVYPGAVLLVSVGGRTRYFRAVGCRCLVPCVEPMETDTIFDLASLTKPLATTLAAMKLVDEGRIHLDDPVDRAISATLPEDKKGITLRMLLSHSAGFPDWKPFYRELAGAGKQGLKSRLRELVMSEPLIYSPGKGTLYSDLGFVALEWFVERVCGGDLSTYLQRHFYGPLSLKRTFLWSSSPVPPFGSGEFAATEDCPWRNRVIRGEVHDENAFAAGAWSGHAGLFGTAAEVHSLVDLLRQHYRGDRDDCLRPETAKTFFSRDVTFGNGTRALGWDTPSRVDSSAGRFFSPNSVGHLGFTGTSVWMDLDKDAVIIFLTNRIHPSRANRKIRAFRPAIHDAVMTALGLN
ncbi:MAG: serine hydrolase [Deltaproteobacteria bacterium]|nr:serine hydrolase [Deltaproteobacteria bacterium]MBW1817233.1 serine hydrolase [Deltaproteobacteria bacterium]